MFNGQKLKISLFGESHGKCVGVSIEGLKSGLKIDEDRIDAFMQRRRSVNKLSTPRQEKDIPQIISGVFNGYTTGGTLTAVIYNEDTKSRDYNSSVVRPSHSDYTANGRYDGFNDYRGGGMFSGRLTAPIVFVGALCDMLLEEYGIKTYTHVLSVYDVKDDEFDKVCEDENKLNRLKTMPIPLLNEEKAKDVENAIMEAKEDGDSVGGQLECMVLNMKPFVGDNYFGRLQSKIASLVFSIPAFVSMELGLGLGMTNKKGSEVNDELYYDENGDVKTRTNNSGGINGGITNGMPIVVKVGVKPTPSISKTQNTINIDTKENVEFGVVGRHDPCIAIRAAVVLESVMNIAILDSIL